MSCPFVVLAALPEEVAAVLRIVEARPLASNPPTFTACHKIYVRDENPALSCSGILAQLEGRGRVHAAVSTVHAINAWKPRFVLVVGTAGGFRSNGVALGDVLVATDILDYESQRLGGGPPLIRWISYQPDRVLLEVARGISMPKVAANGELADSASRVHFGPVLSGDKLVASQGALSQFISYRRGLLGVEMEGAGAAFAAQQVSTPFLMIRGVADHADDNKSEDTRRWSEVACNAVARFVGEFLRVYARRKSIHPETQE